MTTETTMEAPRAKALKPQAMHTCPECGVKFKGPFDAQFCSVKHKQAYHNRNAKRGVVAMPLMMGWRGGRAGGGSKSKPEATWAFSELCRLLDIWNAEDREAGRTPAWKMAGRKMRAGWSAVDYAFG